MALPGFWDDPAAARQVSQHHTHLKNELETWARLDAEAQDTVGLAELLDDGDLAMIADVGREVRRLESTQDRLEVELLLGGQYDRSNAFVTIQSGAGGTEAQDWAEMLLRMYRRWAESRGYRIEVVDLSPGEEAGDQERHASPQRRLRVRLRQSGARRSSPGADVALRCR